MSTNSRVQSIVELQAPQKLIASLPNPYVEKINKWRSEIASITAGQDPRGRVLVVVGPCSIHDLPAAQEYADKLVAAARQLDGLFIVMRTYFEKPRTTVGWKGLINDPDLDGTYDIHKGLWRARSFLLYCAKIGLPTGCEFLDTISPQWLSDLVSWGAIGARTAESQVHRELASGLSMPVGFKNNTSGNIKIAIDAMRAAALPHSFLGVTEHGTAAIVRTCGNPDTMIILRGGIAPNYFERDVLAAEVECVNCDVRPALIVDCSHGNSQKIHTRQPEIALYVANMIKKYRYTRNANIVAGLMIESNLHDGKQKLDCNSSHPDGKTGLQYGVSVTDACICWSTTESLLIDINKLLV